MNTQGQEPSQEPAADLITIEDPVDAGAPPADGAEAPKPGPKSTDEQYDEEYGVVADPVNSEEGEGDEGSQEGEPEPEGVPSEEEKSELQRLREEVEALRQKAEAKKDEPTPEREEAAASQDEDPAPDPADYEFGDADSKFIADFARWNTRQELAVHQQRQELRTEVQRIESGWKEAIAAPEVAELYPDFDEKVTQGASKETWKCSAPMAVLIKRSAVGPHVAYELATKPAEAERLASLGPQELLYEFGRLEGRVSAAVEAKKTPTPAPTPNRASKAPEPPANRSRGAGGKFVTDADGLYSRMLKELN